MRRLALAVLSLAFLATACQPAATELTEEQKAEIEEAVAQAAIAHGVSWRAQEDIDEYMSYASDWGFVPWNYESPDDWRSLTLRFWERWDWESHENRDVQVLVLGPDAAAVQMIGVGVIRDTAGVAVDRTSHIKQVWVREAGEWKLLVARNAFTDREQL